MSEIEDNELDSPVDNIDFEELFERFCQSNTSKSINEYFELICKKLNINLKENNQQSSSSSLSSSNLTRKTGINQSKSNSLLYQQIRSKTNYWKANDLWKIYDERAKLKEYHNKTFNQTKSKQLRVLIIGCGPVGLRLSIEFALLGFNCTIIEKRDRFSRNNVLHLWPFTIHDLKNLGAKKFYGKFCAGSIDHISK
jgi:hypothetical protein